VILAVADGSGGMSGGADAADRAVRLVTEYAHEKAAGELEDWVSLIARIDATAADASGQCALVIAAVAEDAIVGASAGDCGAWLIADGVAELTGQQVRKPLVGSGSAAPVRFRSTLGRGTLLLASDGLLKYAPRKAIANAARRDDLDAAVRELTDLPRLRSGDLPDDVAVVLCRKHAGNG
jgi:serine/threonine protein phosphatase PrpC